MHRDTVALRRLDSLKSALEGFRHSEDDSVRKDAEALVRDVRDAEGNVEGVAATLAAGVRPVLPSLKSPRAMFVSRLLDGVPSSRDDSRSQIDSLVEFTSVFDGIYRGENARDENAPDAVSENPSFDEIRMEIEDCNELCRMYADLFALIQQEAHPKDDWTRRIEIKDNSPLLDVIARETASESLVDEPGSSGKDAPRDLAPVAPPPPPTEDADLTPVAPPPPPTEDADSEPVAPPPIPDADSPTGADDRPQETSGTASVEIRPGAEDRPEPQSKSNGKCADVVFVIDASGSMRECFDQLRTNIRSFVEPFREEGFDSLRLGLLAYSANINRTTKKCIYRNIAVGGEGACVMKSLYGAEPMREGLFFTRSEDGVVDVDEFMRRLDGIRCKGDEDTVFALDCAADFPFGPLQTTRRVMVLFTDEKIEDGVLGNDSVGADFSQVEKVMTKIVDRHVSLYVFAPSSPVTDMMSEFSRVWMTAVPEFRPESADTWNNLDFARVLEAMGKTVSSSVSGGNEQDYTRATFGQDSWEDERWS